MMMRTTWSFSVVSSRRPPRPAYWSKINVLSETGKCTLLLFLFVSSYHPPQYHPFQSDFYRRLNAGLCSIMCFKQVRGDCPTQWPSKKAVHKVHKSKSNDRKIISIEFNKYSNIVQFFCACYYSLFVTLDWIVLIPSWTVFLRHRRDGCVSERSICCNAFLRHTVPRSVGHPRVEWNAEEGNKT